MKPPPTLDAESLVKRELARPNDNAFNNFFHATLHHGVKADATARAALERYNLGGGNTPYVFGEADEWEARRDDPSFRRWHAFHGEGGGYALPAEATPDYSLVRRGTVKSGQMSDSRTYPQTTHKYWVYTSASYDADDGAGAACIFFCDGGGYVYRDGQVRAPAVLDSLVHSGDLPPSTVAAFVDPGAPADGARGQRSTEYDSIDGRCDPSWNVSLNGG